MQIVYCDTCGLRIPDKEFESGRAVKTGERNFCEKCAKRADAGHPALVGAPPPAARPSAANLTPAQRYGINHADITAREARTLQGQGPGEKQAQKNLPMLPIAAGVGAVAVLIAAFALSGKGPKPNTTKTSADDQAANIAPAGAQVADEHRVAEHSIAPKPERDAAPEIPVVAGPNPEKLADEALSKVLKFEGLAAEDRAGRIKALDGYIALHGNTMVSMRAFQMLKTLRADADREEREAALAAQMPNSVLTGGGGAGPGDVSVPEAQRQPGATKAEGKALNSPREQPLVPVAAKNDKPIAVKPAPARSADGKAVEDKPAFKKVDVEAESPQKIAERVAFEAVRKELAPVLQQQRFGAALELLDRKLNDTAMADVKDRLEAERTDVAAVIQLRQRALDALHELAGKKITLKRGKSELSGTVIVDSAKPGIALKTDSGMEMAFLPEQLQVQDIDAFAPAKTGAERGSDLRERGLLFLDINDLNKAQEFFKAAQEAGADVSKELARVTAAEDEDQEVRAKQEWANAESAYALKRYEAAQKAYQNFKATYAKTRLFAQLEVQLKQRLDSIEFSLHPLQEGLHGAFYKGKDFRDEDFLAERIDGKIEFNWDRQAPGPNVPREHFCARWTGVLKILVSGRYTISTVVDDNARLTIDGKQLINDWVEQHAAKQISGTIDLNEGYHDIRLDYSQGSGLASLKLLWRREGTSETVVPPEALWHRTTRPNDK